MHGPNPRKKDDDPIFPIEERDARNQKGRMGQCKGETPEAKPRTVCNDQIDTKTDAAGQISIATYGLNKPPEFPDKRTSTAEKDRNTFIQIEHTTMAKEFSRSLVVDKVTETGMCDVYRIDGRIVKIVQIDTAIDSGTTEEDFRREVFALGYISQYGVTVRTTRAAICTGQYTDKLQRALEKYNQERRDQDSAPQNEEKGQLHGVVWMADGGTPLECFDFPNVCVQREVLVKLCETLKRLENACAFEHRDLHCGNILVHKAHDGWAVRIIDFSLSRMQYKNKIIYKNLDDIPWIFEGDEQIDAQYGVYREMRTVTHGQWEGFFPQTNALWVFYICAKLERMGSGEIRKYAKKMRDMKTRANRVSDIISLLRESS